MYFNVTKDREDEDKLIESISRDVTFRGANLWILIFAIFIASLGLNVNSTAVIIGAMLISPLMGPIIGMGLAIGINDFELFKRSLKNFLVATVISVATATFYFIITPFDEAQSELLARTSPTIYDVLIAAFGGAAGFVATATKGKGNVIPGVAIATALMPPLCTAGYGLAMGKWFYFLGAFYLFFINTVFISLSTYIGVRLMKFKYKKFVDPERHNMVRKYIYVIVLLTMIPAGIMTFNIVSESLFKNNLKKFVNNELDQNGTQILNTSTDKEEKILRIVAIGREIPSTKIAVAKEKLKHYKLVDYELEVIQGVQTDSLIMRSEDRGRFNTSEINKYKMLIDKETKKSKHLNDTLKMFNRYVEMVPELENEVQVLFPRVSAINLAPIVRIENDSAKVLKCVVAIIQFKAGVVPSDFESQKMRNWLGKRVKTDSLRVIFAER